MIISVIIPCYNEELSLPHFYKEVSSPGFEIKDADFEFIFVNDGSTDKTLSVLMELSKEDKRVKYVSFSRNFGKEAAMYAGLEHSRGDFVAVMDADLQDPPLLLFDMYKAITIEKYDCVAARRVTREGEPAIRSFFARCFYKLINKISDTQIVDGARDFRLMTRQVVDAILEMKEYNRFSKGIFGWVGFNIKWIEYKNVKRIAGETKWSFWKLFFYSLEGIVAFSTVPLSIASVAGFLFCGIGIAMICVIIAKTLIWGDPVSGWPSLVCIIFLLSGVQLFCLGILGQYQAKTYLETKRRQIYIVKDTNIDKGKRE